MLHAARMKNATYAFSFLHGPQFKHASYVIHTWNSPRARSMQATKRASRKIPRTTYILINYAFDISMLFLKDSLSFFLLLSVSPRGCNIDPHRLVYSRRISRPFARARASLLICATDHSRLLVDINRYSVANMFLIDLPVN